MKQILLLILILTACSPARAIPTATPSATYGQTPTAFPSKIGSSDPTPSIGELSRCTVTATALNIRTGAGIEHPVIDYLYAGDVVTILDQSAAWYDIGDGWIHSRYCEVKQ
jgi:uncharacterized protein YgiM (DUF1202 family)